jgi:hypothetical protein
LCHSTHGYVFLQLALVLSFHRLLVWQLIGGLDSSSYTSYTWLMAFIFTDYRWEFPYYEAVACSWAPTSKQSEIRVCWYPDPTSVSNPQWAFIKWFSEYMPLLKISTCFVKFWTHSKQFKSWCSRSWPNFKAVSWSNYGR